MKGPPWRGSPELFNWVVHTKSPATHELQLRFSYTAVVPKVSAPISCDFLPVCPILGLIVRSKSCWFFSSAFYLLELVICGWLLSSSHARNFFSLFLCGFFCLFVCFVFFILVLIKLKMLSNQIFQSFSSWLFNFCHNNKIIKIVYIFYFFMFNFYSSGIHFC